MSSVNPPRGSRSDVKTAKDDFSSSLNSPNTADHDEEWWDDEEGPSKSTENLTSTSRLTQWPAVPKHDVSTSRGTPKSTRKASKRYSVNKLIREKSRQRQKKQNAAAGIKVITNFSRHHGPPPVIQQPSLAIEEPQNLLPPGGFVDLAALQALDNQVPSNTGGFWKSLKGMVPNKGGVLNGQENLDANGILNLDTQEAPKTEPHSMPIGSRRGEGLVPPPLRLEADLSPSDRPIVIGLSIPSARLAHHITSPLTAFSENGTVFQSAGPLSPESGIPETPAIVITSSQMPSTWFNSGQNNNLTISRPRATSSVYSPGTTFSANDLVSLSAPPVPQMPPPLLVAKQNRKSKKSVRYSSNTIFSEDDDVTSDRKSRAISSYTVFEEDESPTLTRKSRAASTSEGNMRVKRTSIFMMADQRTSKGWWNYLTSPFLTRSNTIASQISVNQEHPALPSLANAAINAQEGKIPREWEKSVFSPVTPETATTINSDAWWDKQDFTGDTMSPDAESGTLPFMLAAGEATIINNGIQIAPAEGMSDDDSPKRRPAIRDKSSAQNGSSIAGGASTHAEPIPPLPASVTMNPYPQPNLQGANPFSALPALQTGNSTTRGTAANNAAVIPNLGGSTQGSPQPPPYSPPRTNYPRYRAVFPPGHQNNIPEPSSPGPVSPGLQQAMSSRGGIALADVPLTQTPRRPTHLNPGYSVMPTRQPEMFFAPPPVSEQASKKARKAEAKRRRHEKEEAVAHKVGGLWRGRGCISNRGCYGRGGAEGRKKRRCWFGLIAAILAMIILIVVLATTLHHSSTAVVPPTQWLNLTGFPPIFTGISTVAVPDNPVANTGCVFPSTVWSCSLPKEIQQAASPNKPNQPNFRLQIQWDNSSSANATFANVTGNPNIITRTIGGNAVSASHFIRSLILKARQSVSFTPYPATPKLAEQFFLGNTTDGIVSDSKAGEPTPFYVSFLSTSTSISTKLLKRDNSTGPFPDIVGILNSDFPPDVNADGTAAPANLLPYPFQQPLRLYDRGLDTEHYGFYNYFNRSIFVKSLVPLNESNGGNGEVPDDQNGGSTESAAAWRCTWSETRFLVQMWTRKGSTASLVNATTSATSSSVSSANVTANDFTRPGSFPYPTTITTDRHGGEFLKKKLYCYGINSREQPVLSSAKLWEEEKDFGGTTANPAPGLFATSSSNSDPSLGGYDGGKGGCSCQWTNWQLKG